MEKYSLATAIKSAPLKYKLVFAFTILSFILSGLVLYNSIEKNRTSEIIKDIRTNCNFQSNLIDGWIKERLIDASFFYKNPHVIETILNSSTGNSPAVQREKLAALFTVEFQDSDYSRLNLFSSNGSLIVSTDSTKFSSENDNILIKHATVIKKVFLSAIYRDTINTRIYLSLVIPILKFNFQDTTIISFFMFDIDVKKSVFPLLNTTKPAYKTVETILVQKVGDSVQFLNPLRNNLNTQMDFYKPLALDSLPAARAAKGDTGLIIGTDYQGNQVISFIRKIPVLGWSLVVKVNRDEASGESRIRAFFIFFIVAISILLSIYIMSYILRTQKLKYIEEALNAERELNKSKLAYKNLISNLPGMAYRCKNDGFRTMEFVSDGCFDLTGFTSEELQFKRLVSYSILIYIDDIDAVTNTTNQAVIERKQYSCEYRIIDKNKKIRWVWEKGKAVYSETGEVLYLEGFISDITEKKFAREIAGELEKKFRDTFEKAPIGICHIAIDGRIVMANKTLSEMTNLPITELDGYNFASLFLDFQAEDFQELLVPHRNRHQSVNNIEVRIVNNDTSYLWINLNVTPFFNKFGLFEYYLATLLDITQRKLAVEKLFETQLILRNVLDTIPQRVFWKDLDSVYLGCNLPFAKDTGFQDTSKVVGKTDFDMSWKRNADAFIKDDKQVLTSGKPKLNYEEMQLLHNSGSILVETSKLPLRDINGTIYGILGTYEDITERKLAQESKITMLKLRESNKELEEFAYIASHDLQEPLRMVSSFTQLLSQRYKGKLDKDADEFIGFAVDGARRMQVLINDLLDYSRVATRGLGFQIFDCNMLLSSAINNLKMKIEESGTAITSEQLPQVLGDESQLVRLIQNLLDNSIKYRSKKPCIINISVHEKNGYNHFSVTDNGIGFEQKYEAKIFKIFERLHTRSEFPGTGIGLSICKRIVERHGGTISTTSVSGEGSTFYFTLPAIK